MTANITELKKYLKELELDAYTSDIIVRHKQLLKAIVEFYRESNPEQAEIYLNEIRLFEEKIKKYGEEYKEYKSIIGEEKKKEKENKKKIIDRKKEKIKKLRDTLKEKSKLVADIIKLFELEGKLFDNIKELIDELSEKNREERIEDKESKEKIIRKLLENFIDIIKKESKSETRILAEIRDFEKETLLEKEEVEELTKQLEWFKNFNIWLVKNNNKEATKDIDIIDKIIIELKEEVKKTGGVLKENFLFLKIIEKLGDEAEDFIKDIKEGKNPENKINEILKEINGFIIGLKNKKTIYSIADRRTANLHSLLKLDEEYLKWLENLIHDLNTEIGILDTVLEE